MTSISQTICLTEIAGHETGERYYTALKPQELVQMSEKANAALDKVTEQDCKQLTTTAKMPVKVQTLINAATWLVCNKPFSEYDAKAEFKTVAAPDFLDNCRFLTTQVEA